MAHRRKKRRSRLRGGDLAMVVCADTSIVVIVNGLIRYMDTGRVIDRVDFLRFLHDVADDMADELEAGGASPLLHHFVMANIAVLTEGETLSVGEPGATVN